MEPQVQSSQFLVLLSLFFLGLRHGLDLDHLTALADIVAQTRNTSGLLRAICYMSGHGCIVMLLGILAVVLGFHLPSWITQITQPLTGVTLIILSLWLFYSFVTPSQDLQTPQAQVKLLQALKGLTCYGNLLSKLLKPSYLGCFSIGIIHGIGAETPTQVLTLVTVGNVHNITVSTIMLCVFILGMVCSNMSVALLTFSGYANAQKQKLLHTGLGVFTATTSLVVGLSFLLGFASMLPSLSGV